MTEKNIFVNKLLLLLGISDFSLFFTKKLQPPSPPPPPPPPPPKKASPPLPPPPSPAPAKCHSLFRNSPLKTEILSSPHPQSLKI